MATFRSHGFVRKITYRVKLKGVACCNCFLPCKDSSVWHVASTLRRLPEHLHEAACFISCVFLLLPCGCPFRRLRRHLLWPLLRVRGPCGPVIVPEPLDRSNFAILYYALYILTHRQKPAKTSHHTPQIRNAVVGAARVARGPACGASELTENVHAWHRPSCDSYS